MQIEDSNEIQASKIDNFGGDIEKIEATMTRVCVSKASQKIMRISDQLFSF